jgi:carboxyl-terminal processing protease
MRITRAHRLIITASISILVIVLGWMVSPVLPTRSEATSQIFAQVWQTVNDNFYDPKFNGINWSAVRKKYEPQVTQSKSSEEAAALINQMLSELNTSHTHLFTADEPAYYQILGIFVPRSPELRKQLQTFFPNGKIEYSGIGIVTQDIADKIFIRAILEGSPAAEAGLQIGDRILKVNHRPFHPIDSFKNKAGQKVTMSIERSPGNQQNIIVTPKLLDGTTMFLDAQAASTQIIEREGKKIGYVHIWSYASEQYQEQLEEDLLYDHLKDADALVLDIRDGWGGSPATVLNIYTGRGPSITNIGRNGRAFTYDSYWKQPVVMLVNEGSRSAKEILAYGFKQYDIGPVVGTKTAGAVVAGRPFLMDDGSILYVAVADVYVDGKQRLEGKGITPDIEVPFPLEYAQGVDPQKERAIELALEAVKNR